MDLNVKNYTTLDKFFFDFDLQNMDKTPDEYYAIAMNSNIAEMNRLFLGTINHRFKSGMNFIASIHWLQGTGKSKGGYGLARIISKVFGVPYNLNRHLCWTPEEFNFKVSKSGKRETWVLDEQRKNNYGLMSNYIMDKLTDYDNQLRQDQANFIYISPDLEQHSHYYVFQTLPDEIGFIRDNTGYPIAVKLLLKSLRHKDDLMMPRGIIQLIAPSRAEWAEYDVLKNQHIADLKANKRNINDIIEDFANQVIEKCDGLLLKTKKDGTLGVISHDEIYDLMIERVPTELTTRGVEMVIARVKRKLRDKVNID